MNPRRLGLLALLSGVLAWNISGVHAEDEASSTHHLFDGKDLAGFYTFLQGQGKNSDPKKVFTVANGQIHVSGEELGYFATEKEYENYHLTAEFKWGMATHPPRKSQARDTGIMFHFTGPDKVWPRSIEFQ